MDATSQQGKVNRIRLDELSLQKIDRWQEQINTTIPRTGVNRNSIANFIIQESSDIVSSSQLKKFEAQNFDTAKALRAALKQVQAGTNDRPLEELVKDLLSRGKPTQRRKRTNLSPDSPN